MSAVVQLPTALREYTAGASRIEIDAPDVGAALSRLSEQHPLLRRHLYTDSGQLRGYVRVYLNENDLDELEHGVRTPLSSGDVILIVPSIAGGEDPPSGEEGRTADAPAPGEPFSRDELSRYARHFSLPDVGREGQQKLRAARVAIVGAGGLGSPIALYLAAAGVGRIGIIDFDVVDLSNLQRQVLYATGDVGRRKVDVAAARLRAMNPNVDVRTFDVRLTRDNALEILSDFDVVIDGTDNFPTRYLVNDACVLLGKPYVYGSILRFEGQVSVFTGRTAPCYRCLFREPPPPGLVPSCAEGGVLGVLPGIIGSLQALEAIKLITGTGTTLVGRLALFDALTFQWRELRLRRNPDCPVCGDHPTVTALIDYDEFCAPGEQDMDQPQAPNVIQNITPIELKQRLDAGEKITIIDVREEFEWDIANLGQFGARLIPLDQILERRSEIDPDEDAVVLCRSGSRSAGAIRQLRAHGYDRLMNLKGGIRRWAEEIDPGMPTY
ncbi:MAG TPA: molybdopterin-synthase adenylyltransferase MoeB [Longimicrobiales bacterium]|nr:molybdopterin-synthase adenylyltransferase MoeB [Longimicrobiales bacterium]